MIFAIAVMASSVPPCLAADALTAAVADRARPAADTARDADRKPAQVLAFAGIKPGAQVAELFPGGGYYTRLLSAAVGQGGHVYALALPPRPDGKDYSAPTRALAADAHYSNVTVLPLSLTAHALGVPQPVDGVWTTDNYHDMHNLLDGAGMTAFARNVFEALKPGGVFLVVDHTAAPGHGAADTRTLHRMDPETVKAEVTAAGFKFAGDNGILQNANDPHTAKVFEPGMGDKSDHFILKFVKPAPNAM